MDYTDFRKKIAADKDFKAKFTACKTCEDLVSAAAAEGYFFTAEDIRNNTEILPEELENVAGAGFIIQPFDHGYPASVSYVVDVS